MKGWLAALMLLAAPAAGGQERLPPPFPRDGVSLAFENDRVVVWRGLSGIKGRPTAMHRHDMPLVGVFLDDGGRTRVLLPDGSSRESATPTTRGSVLFQPEGVVHAEDALVDGIRAVGIEIKGPRSPENALAGTPPARPCPDARVVLDNDRVVISECGWTPGLSMPSRVRRLDAVVVVIESGTFRQHAEGGAGRAVPVTFGDVYFEPRGKVGAVDVLAGSPRTIVVELK